MLNQSAVYRDWVLDSTTTASNQSARPATVSGMSHVSANVDLRYIQATGPPNLMDRPLGVLWRQRNELLIGGFRAIRPNSERTTGGSEMASGC